MAIKFLDSAGLTYFINKIVYGITSPKFSTGSTYTVGDFVIYTGKLYRCTTAVTVAGAWSASKWVQTTVKGEIKALNTNLNGLAFEKNANGEWGYKVAGADPVIPFSSGFKYVEAISLFGLYLDDAYQVRSGHLIYDPKGMGDQKLLSGSGYYSTGWHMTISVSSSASGSNGNVGTTTSSPAIAIAWIK